MSTAQLTLAATATRDNARKALIERIKEIMLPGARALAATRTATSDYWISREVDLSSKAPFGSRTELIWRDQGTENAYSRRAPWDYERKSPTYSTQVIVSDDATPGQLAELARVAAILTADLVRDAELVTAAQVAALESETAALDAIASEVQS